MQFVTNCQFKLLEIYFFDQFVASLHNIELIRTEYSTILRINKNGEFKPNAKFKRFEYNNTSMNVQNEKQAHVAKAV